MPAEDWAAARRPWLDTVDDWEKEHPLTYTWSDTVIKPQYVVEKLYELTKGEAIITTEVGQNQMWAAQFYQFNKPRQLDDLRRPGHHGLRLPRGHRGAGGQSRTPWSSTSPATAASR